MVVDLDRYRRLLVDLRDHLHREGVTGWRHTVDGWIAELDDITAFHQPTSSVVWFLRRTHHGLQGAMGSLPDHPKVSIDLVDSAHVEASRLLAEIEKKEPGSTTVPVERWWV